MDTYVCGKCGYVAFGEAPEKCPVCAAPRKAFELDPGALKQPADAKNQNDLEKKHIPAIEIKRQCALTGLACVDAQIKIGQVLHVMEEKHWIVYIDLYLNYKFIGRYHLSPELNPALVIHLKALSGELVVLENCNLHGRWIAKVDI
jgi:superoxide reductase